MASHAPLIESFAAATERLLDALLTAAAIQWDAPPGAASAGGVDPVTGEASATAPSERAQGTVSNPTADIATDPRRLRVRAEVIAAEDLLGLFTRRAHMFAESLESAVDAWDK